MNNFTHLHTHDYFSFLDGFGKPSERAKKAKELGMTAMATTNHNHIGGCLEFQQACKNEGIKPILGVELYYTENTSILSLDADKRTALAVEEAINNGVVIPPKARKKDIKQLISDYEYDTKQYHILFLAKNQEGWNNLIKLQSEASRLCTYNARFLCDDNLIQKYKDGLIMTTACIGGKVGNLIMKGKVEEAYLKLKDWHKIFGDDFFIEIQPLNLPEQALVNLHLIKFALENNIKLVATNDVHYTNKEDIDDHDTLLCIGLGKFKEDEDRMKYEPEFWVRSYEEMITAFKTQYINSPLLMENFSVDEYLEITTTALHNTNYVADIVDGDIKLGSETPILPKTKTPKGVSSSEYLTLLAVKGLFKYAKSNPEINFEEYKERLFFELNVINTKGYADYLLIVRDLIIWCKDNDIPVGPGRGSASGSLVLFLTEITKCIDPIKYGLLFSRFLTMDRTSLPDIDTDFSYIHRQRVIKYLKDTYGEDCVSSIGTYTELGVKSGIRDVGRVLRIELKVVSEINKKIDEITDESPSIKFKDLDNLKDGNEKDMKRYEEFKAMEEKYPELFRLARRFEGTKRNQGVHASGILVTPMPTSHMFPVRHVDGTQVSLYTGVQIEEVNGVKLDILGLKTLDVLDIAIKSVDPKLNVYKLYDIVNDNLDNEEMFAALCRRETEGIFQLESALFKGLVSDMMPETLDDITLITSIG